MDTNTRWQHCRNSLPISCFPLLKEEPFGIYSVRILPLGRHFSDVQSVLKFVVSNISVPARSGAAVIIGTMVGSLLLVLILLTFVTVLFFKMRSRYRPEKEFSN